jgi:hypothetical protein
LKAIADEKSACQSIFLERQKFKPARGGIASYCGELRDGVVDGCGFVQGDSDKPYQILVQFEFCMGFSDRQFKSRRARPEKVPRFAGLRAYGVRLLAFGNHD